MEPPDWVYFWEPFGYLGVFLISLIGTASILIPIPYTLMIFWFGFLGFDPIILTLAAGIGSAIGEFSGYILGYYGRKLLNIERQKKMRYLLKMFGQYVPVAIFLFALTPLPDDLLYIPLGILRYNFLKAFIPTIIGKVLMSFILAYLGKTGGEFILLLLGQEGSWIGMIITAILLVCILFVLNKIDWEKVFDDGVKSYFMSNKGKKNIKKINTLINAEKE